MISPEPLYHDDKGCCMALIDSTFKEAICKTVTENYLKAFPEMTGKYNVYICESADGVED